MTEPAPQPPLSALRSQADVATALRWAVRQAAESRSRRMLWLDPDFSLWPLDDPDLLSSLSVWLRLPQRRLVLLAHQFGAIERLHPRFVAWRRQWSHAVDAWTPAEGNDVKLPTLLIDDRQLCLQVFDNTQWRGRLSVDERAVRQWHDEIDALLQRCEAAFPVRPLGL